MAKYKRTVNMTLAQSAAAGMLMFSLACASGADQAAVHGADPAQSAPPSYPNMSPLARYLSASRSEEIALARSAAPESISSEAQILALGPKGYESAGAGKNHFICLVERSWAKNFDSTDFWNPKIRAPHCFNAAAAHSVLPDYLKRTEWVLAGVSKAEMLKRTQTALSAHEIPQPDVGSMAYMMSKDGYLGDDAGGHWHPHLMFYLPRTAPAEWGANLKGSPMYGDSGSLEPMTVFVVPVTHWSDGAPAGEHAVSMR